MAKNKRPRGRSGLGPFTGGQTPKPKVPRGERKAPPPPPPTKPKDPPKKDS